MPKKLVLEGRSVGMRAPRMTDEPLVPLCHDVSAVRSLALPPAHDEGDAHDVHALVAEVIGDLTGDTQNKSAPDGVNRRGARALHTARDAPVRVHGAAVIITAQAGIAGGTRVLQAGRNFRAFMVAGGSRSASPGAATLPGAMHW